MNVVQLLLHIGSVVKVGEDLEKVIADLVAKKDAAVDATTTLTDLGALLTSGAIPLPAGVTAAEVTAMLADLQTAL